MNIASMEAEAGFSVDLPQATLFAPVARIYGEPMTAMPHDLYIPPDALAIMLDAFEGPLDLLLYLIRKANVDILDIPMAPLTRQYLDYIDKMEVGNLELAAEYLVMAAMLIEIKSRMLLPRPKLGDSDDAEDPRAELVRRLMEYEQMKIAGQNLNALAAGRAGVFLGRDAGREIAVRAFAGSFGGGSEGRLDGGSAPGSVEAQSQDQPRRVVGARTHGHHPAHPAGAGGLRAV
jgi:hypothetical protein